MLSQFLEPHPAQPISSAFEHAGVPRASHADETLVDGAQIGIPALGTVAVEDRKHLAQLQDMRRLVEANTQPGDPMFDLANRPALYGYTGRAMAARYSSAYYLGNDRLQRQVLEDLQRTPPKAVFFGPAIVHGEGAVTVRAYRVAKYLLLHYRPVDHGDAVLLVPGEPVFADSTSAEGQRQFAARMALLERVLNAGGSTYTSFELKDVPASWGQSWATMADAFVGGGLAQVTDAHDLDDQSWGLQFGGGPVAGRTIDFVKLEVEWTSTAAMARRAGMESTAEPSPTIDIVWSNNGRQVPRPLRLALPEDLATRTPPGSSALLRCTLVVPVGAHPRWLLSPAVENVIVQPTTDGSLPVFRVLTAESLRLKD